MNRLHIQDSSLPKETAEKVIYRLLEQYQEHLFRFVYFKVGSREQALDIVQDIFTKVWIYLSKGKKIEHEQTFLYQSARNAVIDFYKKKKSLSLDSILQEAPEKEPAFHDSPERNDVFLKPYLQMLPENESTLLYLRYVEDKSLDDIARLLGKTKNATTVRIHRATEKLKQILSQEYYE